jgi:hypothetical protein
MKKLAAFLTCILAFGSVATKAASPQDSREERRREKRPPGDIVKTDKGKKGDRRGENRGDGQSRGNDGKGGKDGKRDKPKKPNDDD